MAYQVIARKWRPQTFEEVTGQEHITRTLRNAIEHERLHHAYLFSGARGVGKTTTARLLAKAVNCHRAQKPTPKPCRTNDPDPCPSCREIAEGRSIDVLEIDAASNTGVDNVRDVIIETVSKNPARDRYRVFIIDEVHMLSTPAFNALLKTLEEPPPRVLFIMATTESHKVPDTILSRCQQFEFRTIAAPRIAERLRLIADAEKIKVSDDALREIARAGEGSMRDAQSAFDQVISFSDGKIETVDVEAALGIAGAEMLARVMRAVSETKPAEALAVVDDLVMRGHDLRNFCRDLMGHLRDLLVVKVAGDSPALSDATESERRGLVNEAKEFSESDLVRFFHSLTETEKNLRESAHPRYQLEIGLVKLIEMRRLAPLAQVIERLGTLEEALRTGQAPAGNTGHSAPPSAAPSSGAGGGATRGGMARGGGGRGASPRPPESFSSPTGAAVKPALAEEKHAPFASAPAAPGLKLVPPVSNAPSRVTADDLPPFPLDEEQPPSFHGAPPEPPFFADIPPGVDRAGPPVALDSHFTSDGGAAQSGDAVSRLKQALEARNKHLLVVALDGAQRVIVGDVELRVEFAPEAKHLRDTLERAENRRILREVCREVMGREMEVRVVFKTPGAADAQLSARDEALLEQKRLRELAENDPRVREVLKTFRAEIVEVRRTDTELQ